MEPVRDLIERLLKLEHQKPKRERGNILVMDMNSYYRLKIEAGIFDDELISWAGLIVHIIPVPETRIEIL